MENETKQILWRLCRLGIIGALSITGAFFGIRSSFTGHGLDVTSVCILISFGYICIFNLPKRQRLEFLILLSVVGTTGYALNSKGVLNDLFWLLPLIYAFYGMNKPIKAFTLTYQAFKTIFFRKAKK